jgi:hypothetical protein
MATQKKTESKEVAVKSEPSTAFDKLKDLLQELVGDSKEFADHLTREDMSIPFISILQQLSPQVVEDDPAFVEGARPGMFINTVSSELFSGKDGMQIVPVFYRASFIEWVTRANGGGFVQEYDIADGAQIVTARNEIGQDIIQNSSKVGKPGNQLNYTHTHYVLIVRPDGTFTPAVLTMTSTQIKPSKDWNTVINEVLLPGTASRAPRFFTFWNGFTQLKSNDQGKWYIWRFESLGNIFNHENGAAIYAAAKSFRMAVESGEKKAAYDATAGEAAAVDNPAVDGEETGDVPF